MAENQTTRVEDVRGSGIYPGTGPFPKNAAPVRSPGALGHPEEWRRATALQTKDLESAALLVGRALFGGYFLYNGVNHFLNHRMLSDYARSKGVRNADVVVPASGLLILAGGLCMLMGARPKLGAGLIVTFLLGVSPRMHAFWKEEDPHQRVNEMVNFTKNVALIGASLLAAAHPEPWPWRVDLGAGPRPTEALVPFAS
jgi:putative oxidoreductase